MGPPTFSTAKERSDASHTLHLITRSTPVRLSMPTGISAAVQQPLRLQIFPRDQSCGLQHPMLHLFACRTAHRRQDGTISCRLGGTAVPPGMPGMRGGPAANQVRHAKLPSKFTLSSARVPHSLSTAAGTSVLARELASLAVPRCFCSLLKCDRKFTSLL